MATSEFTRFLADGVRRFNAQEFFEAHEVWEDAWHPAQGEKKHFLQGLIQAAAAFHKFEEQNYRGLHKLLTKSMRNLEPFRRGFARLDVDRFLRDLDRWNRYALAMLEGAAAEEKPRFPRIERKEP